MKKVKFLLVNDDGIEASGFKLAYDVLKEYGEVFQIAPSKESSGSSHSVSLRKNIKVKKIHNRKYSVDGTPVDCVLIAMEELLEDKPDIVVSGINYGFNLGEDTLYSGTLGAAREGFLYGVFSIAFSVGSLDRNKNPCFEGGIYYLRRIIEEIVRSRIYEEKEKLLLNINMFDLPKNEVKGIKITKLGKRHYLNPIEKIDESTYKIGGKLKLIPEKGTDVEAVVNNYVSITPIRLFSTHLKGMKKLEELFV
jgi:5'-nucleotidase